MVRKLDEIGVEIIDEDFLNAGWCAYRPEDTVETMQAVLSCLHKKDPSKTAANIKLHTIFGTAHKACIGRQSSGVSMA
ncbi:MAG: hypothetical protein PHW76_04080 [Alphaproteobacteria bacterium]|nr:hypothetical protein [Alphaproteobacteria bacterium]